MGIVDSILVVTSEKEKKVTGYRNKKTFNFIFISKKLIQKGQIL